MSDSFDHAPNNAVPRHAKRARQNPGGLIAGIIASVLAMVLLAGGAVGAVVWNTFSKQLTATIELISETDAPPPDIGAIEGGFNILIVGSDSRGDDEDAWGGGGGELNDVNILLHVAQDQQSAVAVSFPRDLQVPICGNGETKINNGLAYGGLACAVQTVSDLSGLPIQFAGMITFDGVVNMSSWIGGVDVCVTGPVIDDDTGINLPEAGTYNLVGYQALAFLRTRGGVGDGSDWGRVSSQQVYLSSMVRKLKGEGILTDPGRVFGLAQGALQTMTLSASLADPYTLVQLALVLKNIPLNRITFVQYPSHGGDPSGNAIPNYSAGEDLFNLIRADQPFSLPAVGDDRASTLNPNGALSEDQAAGLADNSGLPVLEGVTGQTAADFSCSVPNN